MRISDWSSDVCSSDLALDRPAQEEVFLHLHYHAFPAGEAEVVGAGDAGPVQQGVDRDRRVGGGRGDVELGEVWKFLRHRNGDVQRDAEGRESVLLQGADGEEVGRAKEGERDASGRAAGRESGCK